MIFILLMLTLHAEVNSQNPSTYRISDIDLNERAFSDISPVIVKDGLIFCSDRRFSSITDRTAFDGRRIYNMYLAVKKDSTHFENPKMISGERVMKFNNGPLCVSSDGKTVYFTSEVETGKQSKSKKFRNRNGIFIANLSGTELTSVRPFRYNSRDYETAHPSISNDGKFLYFASNMPGGLGKSDIYYCENVNGEWSKPVNMGPAINSSGIENYPFIHPSGRLYFSSDKAGGIGKLDIYATSKFNGEWDTPALIPAPVNSIFDDFSIVVADDLKTGYFSSDRRNDDDIFAFTSTIIRKAKCNAIVENSYCYRFLEENAVKYDTLPFLYRWNFGDGTTADGVLVDHCFESPGKYVVRLDVVNLVTKEVINNEKTDTILVEDEVQPYITAPDEAETGKPVVLDASKTNLPGWNIGQLYWNFGDETIAIGDRVEKAFIHPGTYNIQLIVTEKAQSGRVSREACVSKNITITTGLKVN